MTVDLDKLINLAGAVKAKVREKPTAGRGQKPWRMVRNSADVTEVFIYDTIGEDWFGDGLSAQDFVDELGAVTTPNIHLRISSEGGHVFEGITMHSAIQRHPAYVTSFVDSIAASAASFIAMAGDQVVMAKAARLMIHDAGVGQFYVAGNAADLRAAKTDLEELATLLDSLSDTIAEIYADKAGGTVKDWRGRMAKDTWYTAQEAVDAGLADAIDSPVSREAKETTARWNPDDFANMMKGVFQ